MVGGMSDGSVVVVGANVVAVRRRPKSAYNMDILCNQGVLHDNNGMLLVRFRMRVGWEKIIFSDAIDIMDLLKLFKK